MSALLNRGISKPELFQICDEYSNGNPRSLYIESEEPSFDIGRVHFRLLRREGLVRKGVCFMAISLEEDGAGMRAASALKSLRSWLVEYQENLP